jgi:5-carboxymethyl-2-hydroxymuconate isomerase
MPHIVLEHSPNIVDTVDFPQLFRQMHSALADIGYFKIEDFKSRVLPCADYNYLVGDGEQELPFVHAELRILSGRSTEVQNAAGEAVLTLLREAFANTLHEKSGIISVEVREMNRDTYRKVVGVHATSSGM